MIVSFHPLFRGDAHILCAGREPDHQDLAAMRSASAVILPQGCSRSLYEMARANCKRVFPNYDARFRYPGKTGQIRLFRKTGTPHPATAAYADLTEYQAHTGERLPIEFPLVFKFDWGGEGDTVFLVNAPSELEALIDHADRCERSGQRGFLIQRFVDCGGRSLRVVVIGDRILSYWRVGDSPGAFKANLSKGAKMDIHSDPDLKSRAEKMVAGFCRENGINLAGLDVIYDLAAAQPTPLLLEINYYFGRVGLGGSEAYYAILENEINRWLEGVKLKRAAGSLS
jgi:ribosomal protein S6--L-glutamate ligase